MGGGSGWQDVRAAAAGGGGWQTQGAIAQLREQQALEQNNPLRQLQMMAEQQQIAQAQQYAKMQMALAAQKLQADKFAFQQGIQQQQQAQQGAGAYNAAFMGGSPMPAPLPPMPGEASVPMQQPSMPQPMQQPSATQGAAGAPQAAPQPPPQSQPAQSPAAGDIMTEFRSDPGTVRLMAYIKNANLQPVAAQQAINGWFDQWRQAKSMQARSSDMEQANYYREARMQAAQEAADRRKQADEDAKSGVQEIADAVEKGNQDPTMTGLYKQKAPVLAELQRRGVNVAKMAMEWNSARRMATTMNSPQMVRYKALAGSVVNTIDEVTDLAEKMKNSGVPALNFAEIQGFIKGAGNSEKGKLATKYMTAVNTLKEEFANLANGGYAPTDAAWKLANDQINGYYGDQQLKSSLGEIQKLINFRTNAMNNVASYPAGGNRYSLSGQPEPPAGGGAGGVPQDIQDIMGKYGQ